MPIKIPNQLPATPVLTSENIFVMTETRAITQDIRPLQILLQAGNRTGQVIAVVLICKPQRQLRTHYRNLAGIVPEGIADILPTLAIANRTPGYLIGLKTVATIRAQQR